MRRGTVAGVAGACLALWGAGCGGPSEDELLTAANERCLEAVGPIRSLGPMQGEPRRVEARIAVQLSGQLDALRADIAELDGPDDVRRSLDTYLDHLGERQRGLEEVGELNAPPGRVADNLAVAATSYENDAAGLGLDSCAQMEIALDESVRAAPSG